MFYAQGPKIDAIARKQCDPALFGVRRCFLLATMKSGGVVVWFTSAGLTEEYVIHLVYSLIYYTQQGAFNDIAARR